MGIRSGLFAAVFLFGLGELPTDLALLQPLAQTGAVGVLAWVAWSQRKEIIALRKEHRGVVDVLCQRWDGWEKTRHDDSVLLNSTLAAMRENCAAVNMERRGGG